MLAEYGFRGRSSSVSLLEPFGDAAVDLVGRDLDELPQLRRLARRLEQDERAVDVGRDELAGVHQRAIDVRLGREVHDDVRGSDERPGDRRIGDVTLDELVPGVVDRALQVLQPAGVGELVERGHAPVGVRRQRMAHEVGPNEPGAAGDQHVHHRCHPIVHHGRIDQPADVVQFTRMLWFIAYCCPPNAPRKFENVPIPASVNEMLKRRSCGTATAG